MEKMAWDGPKWGQEDFVPTNPDLADILGRTDLNFETFVFFVFLDPKFLDFQVPRVPEISRNLAWARLGPSWAGPGSESTSSLAAPRQPRRTNLRRSKELGQDRENPISASPVWGICSEMGPYGLIGAHIKTGESPMPHGHFQTPADPKQIYRNQKNANNFL